jgi:tetratricopeptide (TPR) repeat protein
MRPATKRKPAAEAAPLDEARALHEAGAHEQAEPLYRAALARQPTHAETLRLLGLLLHQTGRGEEALGFVQRAAQARPNDAAVQDLLGVVLKGLGRLDEAIAAFTRAVEQQPDGFGPRYNLGNALHAAGRDEEAIPCYRRAIRADPARAWGWNNLADAHLARGAPKDAIPCYRAATRLMPEAGELHFNLAQAYKQIEDWPAAEAALDAAMDRAPANVVIVHQRGRAKQKRGDHETAAFCFAEAIRLQPDEAGLITDLGNSLQTLGRFEESEHWLREALRMRPDDPQALTNLGQLLDDVGQLEEGEALHRAALRRDPTHAGVRYNLCMNLLIQGRLDEGFADYHTRWAALGWKPRFPEPPWAGEPAGVVFVHEDQGVGDYINFCRLVPLAARRTKLVLQVPRPLRRLMRTLAGDYTVIHPEDYKDGAAPQFDRHCPLLDLAHALRLTTETIPPTPYLAAEPALVAAWRERLAALPGRRVGLAWAGNPEYPHDRARSLPFAALAPLEGLEGVSFVSLQKGGAPWTQRPPGALPGLLLHDWTGELGDFADTAALIAALDLVVSVDTSVAHLAGAIGAPVWMLNRPDTDWRWGRQGSTSVWYSNMRIFRQAVPRVWEPLLAEIRAALAALPPPLTPR